MQTSAKYRYGDGTVYGDMVMVLWCPMGVCSLESAWCLGITLKFPEDEYGDLGMNMSVWCYGVQLSIVVCVCVGVGIVL